MNPSEKPSQNIHKVSITNQEIYEGPIPDPETLAKFESIQPGFAERLLSMAEKEQSARHKFTESMIELEKETAKTELLNFKRGQILAFCSVILIVGICAYAFYLDFGKEARDMAVAIIIGLAAIFITGRVIYKAKKEQANSPENTEDNEP